MQGGGGSPRRFSRLASLRAMWRRRSVRAPSLASTPALPRAAAASPAAISCLQTTPQVTPRRHSASLDAALIMFHSELNQPRPMLQSSPCLAPPTKVAVPNSKEAALLSVLVVAVWCNVRDLAHRLLLLANDLVDLSAAICAGLY